MNDDLMTVQEIADKLAVSTRTIRRFIADNDSFEPMELKINPKGSPTPYYSWTEMSSYWDKNKAATMTNTGKMKFMIGHIELEGTEEQRIAIREYVDNRIAQLEYDKDITVAQLEHQTKLVHTATAYAWEEANRDMAWLYPELLKILEECHGIAKDKLRDRIAYIAARIHDAIASRK